MANKYHQRFAEGREEDSQDHVLNAMLGDLEGTQQYDKGLDPGSFLSHVREVATDWRLAGAPIPLVAQYGGSPFDPG